ncbi:MAG: ribbon-helix-helix protein, CopG family [Promethearchaeota archaeon]|nr:MAG: ribbon-helix-helix protein, CopG family [Candidatus Lokiarchaeota archaeon]
MTDVISTRLDEKEIEELNKICEEERIDRSALIRKFLLNQMKEYRMKGAGEKYRKGIVSIAEAATLAEVSIYEMMEYISREKLQSPSLTKKEMEDELRNSEEILKKLEK